MISLRAFKSFTMFQHCASVNQLTAMNKARLPQNKLWKMYICLSVRLSYYVATAKHITLLSMSGSSVSQFLPHDAMHSVEYCRNMFSVRLPIHHASRYCVKTCTLVEIHQRL